MRSNCVNYIEFGPVVGDVKASNGISYMEILQHFCSAECNHLCNLSRGFNEEQFCEIILNLSQLFRKRCCLNDFLSGALATLLLSGAKLFMQF